MKNYSTLQIKNMTPEEETLVNKIADTHPFTAGTRTGVIRFLLDLYHKIYVSGEWVLLDVSDKAKQDALALIAKEFPLFAEQPENLIAMALDRYAKSVRTEESKLDTVIKMLLEQQGDL